MKIKLVSVILVIMVLLTGCTKFEGIELELDKFNTSQKYYCYRWLSWNSTEEAVQSEIGIDMGEPVTGIVNPDTPYQFQHAIYNPAGGVRLFKNEGTVKLEFRDGLLSDVLFTFADEPKKIEEFSTALMTEMTRLYSDKFTVTDHEYKGSQSKTNEWTLPYGTDRTSKLQVILYSRADVAKSVAIHLICPDPKYILTIKEKK